MVCRFNSNTTVPPIVCGGPGSGHWMYPTSGLEPIAKSLAEVPCRRAESSVDMAEKACMHISLDWLDFT